MSQRTYRIHELAARAGVTVKTLHHYDRVGLLQPRRTGARYRVYTDADFARLQRILALRSLGAAAAPHPGAPGTRRAAAATDSPAAAPSARGAAARDRPGDSCAGGSGGGAGGVT